MAALPKHTPIIVASLFTALSAEAALAQALSYNEESDTAWRHSVTPFLFLPARTTGTSTIDGTSVDLDLDLGDVFDLLQGAASIRYEGWNGDFGIISEIYYVRLGVDSPGPLAGSQIDVDVRQTYLSLMGAYRFAEGTTASGQPYALDASAGVRWNRLKQEIDLTGPGPSPVLGGTEDWLEPVIGLRYAVQINDKWRFAARADLSGFGVNGDKLQYTALAGFDWRAWENTSVRFGYQFYGIDYSTERSTGTFAYDIDQHGLYGGISFHF